VPQISAKEIQHQLDIRVSIAELIMFENQIGEVLV